MQDNNEDSGEMAAEIVEKTSARSKVMSVEDKCAGLLSENAKMRKYMVLAESAKAGAELAAAKSGAHSHAQLPEVLDMLRTTGICFVVGPSGSGKSTVAKLACAELFGLGDTDPIASGRYAQISFSPDTTSGEMIGRADVNGQFHESAVVRVFRDGGLILFDEIDDADPSMLIKINTALANGYLSTPAGMVAKSKDTYIVCAANTFGTGPDAMYVGRSRLDAATLDRFCLSSVYMDYDTRLEDDIMSPLNEPERYWLRGYTGQIRRAIREHSMRRVCSTRFVINATAHLRRGKTPRWVKDRFLLGWSDNEKKKVAAAGDFGSGDLGEITRRIAREKAAVTGRPADSKPAFGFF